MTEQRNSRSPKRETAGAFFARGIVTRRGSQSLRGLVVPVIAMLGLMALTPRDAGAAMYTLLQPDQTIFIECAPTDPPCGGTYVSPELEGTNPAPPAATYDGVTGTTNDGTVFRAEPNPTEPATGTGVFVPFVRVQGGTGNKANAYYENDETGDTAGPNDQLPKYTSELGFNTDADTTIINYDAKPTATGWTRSVKVGEIENSDGFVVLQLDANENGGSDSEANKIIITDLQIFIGTTTAGAPGVTRADFANPEAYAQSVLNANPAYDKVADPLEICDLDGNCSGYSGQVFDSNDLIDPPNNPGENTLLGESALWSLDNATNKNVDVVLQSSICDSNGQCGSGHGDMELRIALDLSGYDPNDYFVFHSEYLKVADGFEEWRFRSGGPLTKVSEPAALGLFGLGFIGMGIIRRRRRGAVA